MDQQFMDQRFMAQPFIRLRDYPQIIKRRKWSLFVPAMMISLAGLITAIALPPVYKSSSTILIEEQEIPQDLVMTTVTSFAEQRLQTINQRIMSTTRLLEIIKRFDLYKDLREKKTTEEIVQKMREDVKLKQISADVVDRRTGRPTAAIIAFSLFYEGKETPQTVERVANVLASLFLEENLKVRERQTQETYEFLDEEAARVKKELNTIDSELSRFKEEHINELPGLFHVNIQSLENMERNVERLMEELRNLREREGYLETQLATLSPFMEDKDRTRLDELRVQLVYLQSRFTDEYPDVIKTKDEIAGLEKRLSGDHDQNKKTVNRPDNPAYVTLSSQLASTRADMESIKIQEREYRARADEYRRRIEASPKVEEAYNALVVDRNNTEAKFNDLLQKSMEAKVAQGLEKEQKGERFTLIDPARLPEKPFKPNRAAILLVGCILGLAAGAGLTAVREITDQTVRIPEILTVATSFPVLALLPEIVTPSDERARKRRRLIWVGSTLAAVAAGVVLFHYWIMDLDIFWIKLFRRLESGL